MVWGLPNTYDICNALASRPWNDREIGLQLANQYGLNALKQADQMPIGTEIAFLRSILNDTGVANTDEKKVTLRSKKSVLYLQAWQRLLSEYDPLYVQRPFSFNVEPPPGAGGIPGMDPSWITDLKLRQEYEALIEENGNNMRANNRQRSLSDLNDTYPKQAEKYLIASYSTPPYNFEELRGLLDLYITDKAVKTRILDSVAKKMGLK